MDTIGGRKFSWWGDRHRRLSGFLLLCLWAGGPAHGADEAKEVGRLPMPPLDEASGLAPSRRASDLLWSHNDSGGAPVLYAISTSGHLRGAVRLQGVKNQDWEDIASFQENGQSYLLVADVGDNKANRTNAQLLVIAEPSPTALTPGAELPVPVAWTIPVRYPEGPMDCEAVAVDAREQMVYLLGKRAYPNPLYRLPLHPPGDPATLYAERLGKITTIPRPNLVQLMTPSIRGTYLGQPTAMAFSDDGRRALILTYGQVLVYDRPIGKTWLEALSKTPVGDLPHTLPQAEAVCFSADGRAIFATSESGPPAVAPALVRWALPGTP